jgi:hypothetical protein
MNSFRTTEPVRSQVCWDGQVVQLQVLCRILFSFYIDVFHHFFKVKPKLEVKPLSVAWLYVHLTEDVYRLGLEPSSNPSDHPGRAAQQRSARQMTKGLRKKP